ncbi:MAG TPA: zinc-binding dehydrogenase [Pyrinomonadaceae bacterium]|jgi:NADPH:quinone reductase-like Zn-dependent oxidoreductase|nr:zinc-binding dehydrogenase [Pyrinomonadaceae bacterium]
MKAIIFKQHGGPEVLEYTDVPDPSIRADEVLVEVKACALNHLDIFVRNGMPGIEIPLPHILGNDIAGVVKEVGELVTWAEPGDEVMVQPGVSCGHCAACLSGQDNLCREYDILGYRRNGGYAELVAVPGANLIPKPAQLSWAEAAALPLVTVTAWHMLVTRAAVQPGEDVLVHAAGSGVGSIAIQIAKLRGARVITTASSDEKLAKARELGADATINYSSEDWPKEVKRLTDRRGVDVVVEHTGAATWPGSIASLKNNGRLVTCGATSGYDARTDLRQVFYRHLTLLGSFMGSKAELLEAMKFVTQGKVRAVVDRVLPLSEARQAHELMENRGQFGKIVLEPRISAN